MGDRKKTSTKLEKASVVVLVKEKKNGDVEGMRLGVLLFWFFFAFVFSAFGFL